MFTGKFFLTVFLIAVAITFIQWFFTGFLVEYTVAGMLAEALLNF